MSRRWMAVLAVMGLVLAGLLGWGAYRAQQPDSDFATPANHTEDGTGLVVGDGPVTVEIWLDFHCPHCREFERQAAPTLNQLVADREIQLVYHPVSFLDRQSFNQYSTRAASVAGCGADFDAHPQYVEALLAAQPAPGRDGLTDAELIAVGESVGITDPAFGQCVRDQRYRDWTRHVTEQAAQAGVTGVPAVQVDGEPVPPSAPEIVDAVRAAG